MPPLNTAVIGAGMALGMLHWPSIACQPDLFRLHSVLDRSGRGNVREMCGEGVKVVHDLEGVVGDAEVELVVVAGPNATHFDHVSAALNAGKHVLVEKPITPTAAEARRLIDLARAKGVILAVYQNRRLDSDFLTVKKLLQDETLGDIIDMESAYDRYRPLPPPSSSGPRTAAAATWKTTPGSGNDVIYNLGSHIIDQAYTLFGLPERLSCRSWDPRGIGLDEAFHMTLYYPAPPLPNSDTTRAFSVTLRATILSAMPRQLRFSVRGTRGSYTKRGVDPQERQMAALARRGAKDAAFGKEDEGEWGEVVLAKEEKEGTEWETTKVKPERGDWPHLYANLHAAITARDPGILEAKPEQAAEVIRLIELGLQSSREGRVVDVTPEAA